MEGRVIGHFKIIREIGRGGKGVVYLAEDQKLHRKVALKFLKQENVDREKILQEARSASRLTHPGVATIYDVLDSPEGPFIVMEYVQGDSLANFLQTHRIELPFAMRLARNILEVVIAAHQYNLIHGDLKPNNIIITPDGKPRIVDFGLAAIYTSRQDESAISGTLPLIAPEKIIGSPSTEQTDIYALGIIFFQLFTGLLPFRKEHQAAQIYAIMQELPPDPCEINAKLPQEIGKIILRCLEKDPRARYPSANSLLADIKSVEISGTRETRGVTTKIVIVNAIIFLVIFGFIVFLLYRINERPLPVQSIQEISLPQPVNLGVDFHSEGEDGMEVQTRLFALVELLREQLQHVNGINIQIKEAILPGISYATYSKKNVDFTLDLKLEKNFGEYQVGYNFIHAQKNDSNSYRVQWRNFNDVIWISQKILSDLFEFILDKDILIKESPDFIKTNVMAYHYFANAMFHYREKNYEAAIQKCEDALSVNPFFSQAYYFKGLSLSNQNEYEQAIREFFNALPEINKQGLIDWQLPLPDTTENVYQIHPIKQIDDHPTQNSPFFLVTNVNQEEEMLIVQPVKHQSFKINFPENFQNYQTRAIYYYKNSLVFKLWFKESKINRIIRYDLTSGQLRYTRPLSKRIIHKLPYFYSIDRRNNMITQINVENLNKAISLPTPWNILNFSFSLTSNPDKMIAYNDSLCYQIDFKTQNIRFLQNESLTHSALIDQKYTHNNYLLFTIEDKETLFVQNLLEPEEMLSLPLLETEEYRLSYAFIDRSFILNPRDSELYVLQPDTTLNIYEFTPRFRLVNKYSLLPPAMNVPLTPLLRTDQYPYQKEKIFYNRQAGKIFLFNSDIPSESTVIELDDRIDKISLNTENFIFVEVSHKSVGIDKRNGEIFWELQGKYNMKAFIPERDLLVYQERDGFRLAFYQYSTQKFWGSYLFPSRKTITISYFKDHIYFIENNLFKSLDVNSVLRRNPLHLANIYQRIAECYFRLGDYPKALKYADKVLTELQPNNAKSLLLKTRIYLKKKNLQQVVQSLPQLYALLPAPHPSKIAIRDLLFKSGLYEWETFVNISQGNRLLTGTDQAILFTDAKSAWKNWLWKLDRKTGEILWKFPYLYRFNGTMLSPSKFFFTQAESRDSPAGFYVLNLNSMNVLRKLSGHCQIPFTPKLYSYDENTVISYFKNVRGKPNCVERIDLRTNHIEEIMHRTGFMSEPYMQGDVFYFFVEDSLYMYNLRENKMQIRPALAKSLHSPGIRQILDVSDSVLTVVLLNNDIFRLDLKQQSHIFIDKAFRTFPRIGFINRDNEIYYFKGNRFETIHTGNTHNIEDLHWKGGVLYILQSDRLLTLKDGNITAEYPLLWTPIEFMIIKDHAYILTMDGKIYSVNLNWRPAKLKKDLILSMNSD